MPWASFSPNMQRLAYAHALCSFGPDWRWMTFLDLDEFLFPVKDESLCSTLSRYENLAGIAVPWHNFGFCGHERRPPGLIIENYTRRLPFPPPSTAAKGLMNWKSIVDPMAVEALDSPHFMIFSNGQRGAFTEDYEWITHNRPDGWECLRSNVFRLNHYFTKSREDFARRRSKGGTVAVRGPDEQKARNSQYVASLETEESVEDNLILRYVPKLRRAINSV